TVRHTPVPRITHAISLRTTLTSRTAARTTPSQRRPPCRPAPLVEGQRGRAASAPSSYYPVAVSVIPPSGRQYVLTSGDQRAVVTEVGAGLREYTVGVRGGVDGF